MVKFIGEANQVVKHVNCKKCDVRLEYVPRDVKTVRYKDYSNSSSGHEYIRCPCCNSQVITYSW